MTIEDIYGVIITESLFKRVLFTEEFKKVYDEILDLVCANEGYERDLLGGYLDFLMNHTEFPALVMSKEYEKASSFFSSWVAFCYETLKSGF